MDAGICFDLLVLARKDAFAEGYKAGTADGRLRDHGMSIVELRAALAEAERLTAELLKAFGV